MAMKMKKKNSLPDMYSPEKRFSGFFVYMACWSLSQKQKKELAKLTPKKRIGKTSCIPAFYIFAYSSYYTKGSRQSGLPDFYKKAKIYRNSGGKNNETF